MLFSTISIDTSSISFYTKSNDDLTFILDKGFMKFKVCMKDIIELKYILLTTINSKNFLIIKNKWRTTQVFTITQKPGKIIITICRLKIKVDKSSNAISYIELNDVVILAEDKASGKEATATTIAGINTYNCSTLLNLPVCFPIILFCYSMFYNIFLFKNEKRNCKLRLVRDLDKLLMINMNRYEFLLKLFNLYSNQVESYQYLAAIRLHWKNE